MILMLMIHSSLIDHFLRSSFQAESRSSEAEARAEAEETKRATGEDWDWQRAPPLVSMGQALEIHSACAFPIYTCTILHTCAVIDWMYGIQAWILEKEFVTLSFDGFCI